MSTNSLDITFDQGSSYTHIFTIQNAVGGVFDLTGFDARMQVRRTFGATTVLINCTLANGKLELTNPAGGVLTLNLLPSDTNSIRFDNKDDETLECVYDLEIQSPEGRVYKPSRGSFILNREVTR